MFEKTLAFTRTVCNLYTKTSNLNHLRFTPKTFGSIITRDIRVNTVFSILLRAKKKKYSLKDLTTDKPNFYFA